MLEAEKNLGKYYCMLALVLNIPVAGHVCLDRGLATDPSSLPQVHAEAQVAEREGKKDKMPKKPRCREIALLSPSEAGQKQGRC